MNWDEKKIDWQYDGPEVVNGLRIADFSGCCSAKIVTQFPYGEEAFDSEEEEDDAWIALCTLLSYHKTKMNRRRGDRTATYFTLSEADQQIMIFLVEACPYIQLVDTFLSRHGNWNVNLYKVEL